jgi:Peptidase propeptide and YPEB domain
MRVVLGVALLCIPLALPATAEAQQLPAKVDQESAKSAALARVPNGAVAAVQLKVERGTLVYIYDISAPGKPGLEEVRVSAVDGQVVSVQHLGGQTDRAAPPGRPVADRVNGAGPPR